MAVGSKDRRNPATCLTDDLIVEILSRLPVKSVCRFRCVSRHWRGLISHPDHRKKLPQTLAGFFYQTTCRERFPESARNFTNVYVVCNPATEDWTALPESSHAINFCQARLGFDPAVSPNFHVFEFEEMDAGLGDDYFIDGLEIYSSEAGQWAHRDSGWSNDASLWDGMSTVFLNGFLHVLASEHQDVRVVDTEGNSWRTIPVPHGYDDGFIGHSQGHLYYLNTVEEHDFKLAVYVLEDYASDE